jgi:Spy/CpxP family protein refolding chaperone
MKKTHVIRMVMGAALLSGSAFAQAEEPQDLRGEGRGFRPEGGEQARMERRERMERRGPGSGFFGPEMRPGRGPEGEGAGPRMGRGGNGPEGCLRGTPDPKRLKEAGATDQQLDALKAFHDEQQLKRIDLKAAAEKAEVVFEQLMRSETVDEKAALKAAETLSQARAEIFKAEVASQLKFREILGADVLKKLREDRAERGADRPGCPACPMAGACKDAPPAAAGERAAPRGPR